MSKDMTAEQAARDIIEHLEARAGDQWEDHLWPAAFEVLCVVADELRERWGIKRTDTEEWEWIHVQQQFLLERKYREKAQKVKP
jgi:acetyl-CoA acetyltransferase